MGTTGGRILLVEDHADTLETFTQLLKRWGHPVVSASTAAEAIGICQQQRDELLRLLICDIGLPDQPGTAVMRALRAVAPTVPGIALTGYGMEGEVAAIMAAGFDRHLLKPVEMALFKSAVDELLMRRSMFMTTEGESLARQDR
jgi:CheY-like chemotaxis protein